MSLKEGDLVLPGDIIKDLTTVKGVTLIGPGLVRGEEANTVVATRAGILCHKPTNLYWIETPHKRYIPKKGDLVVGIITKKGGDNLKVDIGSAEFASLSMLAFEGATKKQKPDLQVGDLVYAKLLSAHREMEPELVCIDKYFKAVNLGPLSSEGNLITVVPNLAHKLLSLENPLLKSLGRKFPFEIAIGMNGKIWFRTKTNSDSLVLMQALSAAEHQSNKDINEICNKLNK